MKTSETIAIEKHLYDELFGCNPNLAKEYGTSEVTIGFQRDGLGKEKVDFMSYNPKKDEFRCYEIKISMSDFKSKAKKSWYGNYNYLVISESLYNELTLEQWKESVPKEVGIMVINTATNSKQLAKLPKRMDIEDKTKQMLEQSLIRTLFYQNYHMGLKSGLSKE